jgi:hypothetical protein
MVLQDVATGEINKGYIGSFYLIVATDFESVTTSK